MALTVAPVTEAQAACSNFLGFRTCTGTGTFSFGAATGVEIDGSPGTIDVTSGSVTNLLAVVQSGVGVLIHDSDTVVYTNTGAVTALNNGINVVTTVNATLNVHADVSGGVAGIGIGHGVGLATVNNDGHTIQGAAFGISLGDLTGNPTDVVINNNNGGTIQSFGSGIFGSVDHNLTVNNAVNSTIQGDVFGMSVIAGNDITVDNNGAISGGGLLGVGGGAYMISTGGNIGFDNTGGLASTSDGAAIFAAALDGTVNIGGDAASSATSVHGPGIIGIASGNVTIDAGTVNAGPNGPITTGYAPIDAVTGLLSGGVMGVSLGAGDTAVNLHGDVTVADGAEWGALAFSAGGAAAINVDSGVTVGGATPSIGLSSIVLGGAKDASVITGEDVTVHAQDIGILGVNLGAGKVKIDAEGAAVTSEDGPGIIGLGLGNVTIDAGTVNAGAGGPVNTGNATIDGLFADVASGGVLGYSLDGGNTLVNLHGDVTVADGATFGALAFSNGGAATINADAGITVGANSPVIGMASITFGPFAATVNAQNATVNADKVGILGANFGTGNVYLDNEGGSVNVSGPDGVGILGFSANLGPTGDIFINSGDVNVADGSGIIGGTLTGNVTIDTRGTVDANGLFGVAGFAGNNVDINLHGNNVTNEDGGAGGIGVIGVAGVGDAFIETLGGTVVSDGPGIIGFSGGGNTDIHAYDVTSNFGSGILGTALLGNVDIEAGGTVMANGLFGIGGFAGNNVDINFEDRSITNPGGVGVAGFAGVGNADLEGAGSSVVSDGTGIIGFSAGGNTWIDSGFVQSANGSGVVGTALTGNTDIDLHDNVFANGDFGVAGFAGGNVHIDLQGHEVGNDFASVGGDGVIGAAFGGNVTIDGAGSSVAAQDVGIGGFAVGGNVNITADTVNTGAGTGFISGGVLGFATGGDVNITANGPISTGGNFGAMGVSIGGNATVVTNGTIDPPMLVGAGTFTFGPGTAHTTVNSHVDALGVGVLAGNVGSGDAIVDLNASASADFIGVLATNVGDGQTDVNVHGAIGGYSAAATGDDGINVFTGFGTGDVNVNTFAGATINAGDDGIDVYKIFGAGNVMVATGADITAVNEGIAVFRTVTNGDTEVNVGQNGATKVWSKHADGVQVFAPATSGNVFVNVSADSAVVSRKESAIKIGTFDVPVAADNNVEIESAGRLIAAGTDPSLATIVVNADGYASVVNDQTGVIKTRSEAPDAYIMNVSAGQNVDAVNQGKMVGAVELASAEGDVTLTNVYGSGGIWQTSGYNLFSAAGDATLENLEGAGGGNPVITTYGTTTFSFVAGGNSLVTNQGDIYVNGVANFGDTAGPLDNFNNRHGLLSMINGISDYGVTVTPYYNSGVGDQTNITGNFNGGSGSFLGVDAALAAPGNSSADLMVVGGNVTAATNLVVNNVGALPGASNETGIPVVEVLSGNTAAGDFVLDGGPIDTGLFNYDLYLDKTPGYTPAGYPDTATWLLASTPNARAFELPAITSGVEALWNTSAATWHDRTTDLRKVALGSPSPQQPNGVWVNAFGSAMSTSGTDRVTLFGQTSSYKGNYDQNIYGFLAGVDRSISAGANGEVVLGLLGGYLGSDMDFKSTSSQTNMSGGTAGAYATYLNGGLFVDSLFKADFVNVDHSTNYGGPHSKASTDAVTLGGVVDTGYRVQPAGQNAYVEPLATLAYSSSNLDNMKLLGNTVAFGDGNNFIGRLGLRIGTTFAAGNGTFIEPFFTASIWNQFDGDNSAKLSSPGASAVKVTDDTGGVSYQVGGGFEVRALNGWSAFAKGDYQWGDGAEGGSGHGGIRLNW